MIVLGIPFNHDVPVNNIPFSTSSSDTQRVYCNLLHLIYASNRLHTTYIYFGPFFSRWCSDEHTYPHKVFMLPALLQNLYIYMYKFVVMPYYRKSFKIALASLVILPIALSVNTLPQPPWIISLITLVLEGTVFPFPSPMLIQALLSPMLELTQPSHQNAFFVTLCFKSGDLGLQWSKIRSKT